MDTKLIFVTGGVVSGLGKGITAASLGRLLKARGYSVSIMKLDPYLNVDPGTMNPYQHGEVFVTDDGAETDLDIGHYERFINEELTKLNNTTTGQIYSAVIERERTLNTLARHFNVELFSSPPTAMLPSVLPSQMTVSVPLKSAAPSARMYVPFV